jgi:hypothetical protein
MGLSEEKKEMKDEKTPDVCTWMMFVSYFFL